MDCVWNIITITVMWSRFWKPLKLRSRSVSQRRSICSRQVSVSLEQPSVGWWPLQRRVGTSRKGVFGWIFYKITHVDWESIWRTPSPSRTYTRLTRRCTSNVEKAWLGIREDLDGLTAKACGLVQGYDASALVAYCVAQPQPVDHPVCSEYKDGVLTASTTGLRM